MLKITTGEQVLFFKEYEIVRFEANSEKTLIYFVNGTRTAINQSIDNIETQLKESGFIRIHQQHLVNVNHITSIPNQNPGIIEINKTHLLPIIEEQRKIIIQLISSHLKNSKS